MDIGYVYILLCNNSRYYIGSTNNITIRMSEHQLGKVKSTKHLRPLALVYYKKFDSIKIARKVEYLIKSKKSKSIITNIVKDQEIKFNIG